MSILGERASMDGWAERTGSDRLSLFFTRMRRNWRLAAAAMAVCVLAAAALAFLLPRYWRIEIVVMPVQHGTMGSLNLGALASGLGGLGALLRQPASTEDEALAVLRSRELFDIYAKQQNLLPVLFDSRWDSERRSWAVSPSRIPTLREGYKLFNTHIRDIDVDRRTGIVTMSITWKDRTQAIKWAQDLIDLTNAQLRERALAEAAENMRYLGGEMRGGQGLESSNALNAALGSAYEHQLQSYMFAKGEKEFAFRIIDPPTYPDDRERVWPQRGLLLVLGVLVGALVAVFAVQAREWAARVFR